MENQGYEEEHSRAAEEQSTLEFRYRDREPHDRIDRGDDPLVARSTPHPEGHVYEDISGEKVAPELSERISLPNGTQDPQKSADFAKQAWINRAGSSPPIAIPDESLVLQTLSSPAEISTNHDSGTSSSRTKDDDLEKVTKNLADPPGPQDLPEKDVLEKGMSLSDSNKDDSSSHPDRRTNRRRRKKDCKHCRSKLVGVEKLDELAGSKDEILKDPDLTSNLLFRDSLLRPQNIKIYPIVKRTSLGDIGAPTVFFENELNLTTENAAKFLGNDRMLGQEKMLRPTDMRINSIYSQDRWYGKDSPIFYTDVKDQNPFQRAYSLPARTHTPTSQNRVNLRRSVRNEPPPHPARLDKHHRRGWTLHLARPLRASICTNPLVPLLIILLILLGVAGVALYIVFEPEKLQIIQQYLKSSGKLTEQNATSGEPNDEPDLIESTSRMMTTSIDAFSMAAFLNSDASFPENVSSSTTSSTSVSATTNASANATRYCDDCLENEVCVALVNEEVPMCKSPRDREDLTGCAGFCVINKQKCHRLDVDAFRCVEIEHYCLEDEWTCSNTLCIPLKKRCDGHMNCYDHSDEYNCDCNLETHFQCGNETSCLPLERRCDGKIDCWDATDEINCTLACPLDNQFTCNNGDCILKTRFCDGLSDCKDGSDEPHGCQGRCNKHEFTCQNGRCITKGMKCNGNDDCGDGTDERHCKDRFT
ncbi:uncharacterized protein LOC114945430 isoform X2 [Nylanderia fulva]|uniref:uncharacterized protein LOC114945430 isoform X2 n=1 Tax=Nylanderia fulva TaxID=613905 RepID=UPI0010FBB759|nr:uncharacterized protein LOC114945430 isoform X2 [Nylanderia fulva]